MSNSEGFAAKPRRKEGPHWIWGVFKSTQFVIFILSSIFPISLVLYLVLSQWNEMVIIVEPISLPPSMTSIGYSGEVFRDKMVSESQRLLGTRRASDGRVVHAMETLEPECFTMRPFLRDLKSDYIKDFSYSIRFDGKREKGTYEYIADTITYYLERMWFFRHKSVSVRGEIIPDGDLFTLRLTATFSWGKTHSSTKILGKGKQFFAEQAGHELIKFAAPWVYVSSRIFHDLRNGVEAAIIVNDEFRRNNQALNQSMMGFAFAYSGKMSQARQNLTAAEKHFGEALIRSPANYWALIGRSHVESTVYFYPIHGPKRAIQWDSFNRIQTDLQRAIDEDLDNPEAYVRLFSLYWAKGDMQQSEKYQNLYLEKSKKRGEYVRAMIGVVLSLLYSPEERDHRKAESELHRLRSGSDAKGDSDYSDLQLISAMIAVRKGEVDSIRILSRELLKTQSWCALEMLRTSFILEETEHAELIVSQLALKELDSLYGLLEESGIVNFKSVNSWGVVLYKMNESDRAIEKFKKAFEYHVDDTLPLANWGFALIKQGKYLEAESKFLESIKIMPTMYAIEGHLASMWLQMPNSPAREERLAQTRKFIDTLEHYERKYEIESSTVMYVAALANCSVGNYEKAITYKKRISKWDQDPVLLRGVEECLQHSEFNRRSR